MQLHRLKGHAENVAAAAPGKTAHGKSHHQQTQKRKELKKNIGK
jgi:hypothetical protein